MSGWYSGVFLKLCLKLCVCVCVCVVGYKFMQLWVVSPRSALYDKRVVTICGMGRQREIRSLLTLFVFWVLLYLRISLDLLHTYLWLVKFVFELLSIAKKFRVNKASKKMWQRSLCRMAQNHLTLSMFKCSVYYQRDFCTILYISGSQLLFFFTFVPLGSLFP
jgi:hypothetical protein